ncbi:MAG: efflux RND transporter periplasmic adaptor subunit [Acetivibrionales bacterium]|jgi:HlyD family secretion protein
MKKKIVGAGMILVIITIIAVNIARSNGTAPAFGRGNTYNVDVVRVQKGEISSSFSAGGVVEELEKHDVSFDTLMKIEKIFVEKNQRVSKGQQIMQLDMSPLESELRMLEIEREKQELTLLLDDSGNEAINARYELEKTDRDYNDARKEYENKLSLYNSGAMSKSELESAESAMKNAEDALKNARQRYDNISSRLSIDAKTKELNLEMTRMKILDLQKRIKKISDNMYSPVNGAVAELNIVEGSYTDSGSPAYTVINTERLRVKAMVNEYNISSVKEGQKVVITGDAIPEDKEVTGEVRSISPLAIKNSTLDGEEVVVEVAVDIDKTEVNLKPGLNVSCDILTESKSGILAAPMETIMEDKDGGKFVYVVDEENSIMVRREVKLGVYSDMIVEVLDGINEGELVVLNPQPIFKDGAGVRIMNPEMK